MLRFRYVTLKAESGKNPTLTGDYSPRHSSRRSERLSAHAPKGPRLKQASLLLQRTLPVLLQQQRPVQINPFRLLPKQKGRRDSQRSAQHATNHHVQRSEEHTSELQSLMRISYAVFCLKKKNTTSNSQENYQK